MSEVARMTHHHTAQIASLHINNLHTNFRGRSGNRLLEIYYRSLVSSSGGVGFIALIDNDVVGYTCGIWDAGTVRKELIKHFWPHLLFWLGWQVVENPKILRDIYTRITDQSEKFQAVFNGGCELRPIVISEPLRGQGLADKLLFSLLLDVEHKGFSHLYLITEIDNIAANKFYIRSGFELIGTYDFAHQKYSLYQISLQPNRGDVDVP